jgi:hypothetical protein
LSSGDRARGTPPVVRFVCARCGADFPAELSCCAGCGESADRRRRRAVPRAASSNRLCRLISGSLSAVTGLLALGGALALKGLGEPFGIVILGSVLAVLYANLAIGAFRNRRGALLAAAIVSCFPALMFGFRSVEFAVAMGRGDLAAHARALAADLAVFLIVFVGFAAHVAASFVAWLRHGRG